MTSVQKIRNREDERSFVSSRGAIRVARRKRMTYRTNNADLQEIAKKYALDKVRYWSKEKGLNKEQIEKVYAYEARKAYRDLLKYRELLVYRNKLDIAARTRQDNSNTHLREDFERDYEEIRLSQMDLFKTIRLVGSILFVLLAIICVCLLINYTSVGNSYRENYEKRDVAIVVYSPDNAVQSVEIGRGNSNGDVPTEPQEVQNSSQFEIPIDGVHKRETVKVVVRGSGVVGCKIKYKSTSISLSDNTALNESQCQAGW